MLYPPRAYTVASHDVFRLHAAGSQFDSSPFLSLLYSPPPPPKTAVALIERSSRADKSRHLPRLI